MMFNGDIVVREVTLPPGVHGAVREDPDGIVNVYINDQDCREEKLKTLRHELRHYELHHIGSGKTVRAMETEAG